MIVEIAGFRLYGTENGRDCDYEEVNIMQIESYRREIEHFSIDGLWHAADDYSEARILNPQPLDLQITGFRGAELSDEDWQMNVFPFIESDYFPEAFGDERPQDTFFREHYSDIVRGRCDGWRVANVEITPVAIILQYDYPESLYHDTGPSLWLMKIPEGVYVTITAPSNRAGLSRSYTVQSWNNGMCIEYDLEHVHRDILLQLKDPLNTSEHLQRSNQIATITEYTDI